MIDVVTAFFSVPLGFQHVLLLSHFVGLALDVLESIRQKEAEVEAIQNEEVQLDVVQLLDCFLLKNQPKKGEAIAWCHGSMQQIMYIFDYICIDIFRHIICRHQYVLRARLAKRHELHCFIQDSWTWTSLGKQHRSH